MPELPEVEVTRRSIAEPLRGASVLSARVGKPLRWPLGCAPHTLAGATVGDVLRRGKYLWLPLLRSDVATPTPSSSACTAIAPQGDTPAATAQGGLLLHLGMSGSLALLDSKPAALPGPHDHFDLVTSNGTLRLNDPRRFGAVVWSSGLQHAPAAKLLQALGPEPFDPDLTPLGFHAALQRRGAPIKAVLLAGDAIVGAGNIYACEALFLAGIHPALAANRISRPRAERLLAAIRQVLGRALELGGSTLRDFSDAHGVSGAYQAQAHVYGRAGLPCLRCNGPIKRVVQGQRSTFFCPQCQRR